MGLSMAMRLSMQKGGAHGGYHGGMPTGYPGTPHMRRAVHGVPTGRKCPWNWNSCEQGCPQRGATHRLPIGDAHGAEMPVVVPSGVPRRKRRPPGWDAHEEKEIPTQGKQVVPW